MLTSKEDIALKIKELDVILLKDGKEATVLECYDSDTAFYVEVSGKDGKTTDMLIVKIEDIEKILYVA